MVNNVSGCTLSAQIKEHTPLVRRLANQLIVKVPANVEKDDLIQAGLIGLLEAITRFEEALGVHFETFAASRIRGAMIDCLRNDDWMSRGNRRQSKEIERVTRNLRQKLNRAPYEREIAALMGMSLSEYQKNVAAIAQGDTIYLEDMVNPDDLDGSGANIFLSDHKKGDPLTILEHKSGREKLVEAIGDLPERLRYVMEMIYDHDMPLQEIADQLGVTTSRVCQINAEALEKLKVKYAIALGPVRHAQRL